jgi:hypothetical protein
MQSSIPRRFWPGVASALAIGALIVAAPVASAHEHREVGEYTFNVGFMEEPALVNQPNGIFLEVVKSGEHADDEGEEDDGHGGAPVEGLHETLTAEISYAGETKEVELREVFDIPGRYTADIIPTQEGTYTFRFFGTVEGTEVDESFTGGPDTFSEVESTANIAFPSAGIDSENNSAVADAEDAADSARTLAIVGIIAGVLGLAVGAAGLMMAMAARSTRAAVSGTTVRQTGD